MNSRFRFRLIYGPMLLRRRRLSIALVALGVGATLLSALLSTYADLEQKMGREFSRYGANIVIAPRGSETLPETSLAQAESLGAAAAIQRERSSLAAVPFLYVVGRVNDRETVLAGTDFQKLRQFSSAWQLQGNWPAPSDEAYPSCLAGERLGKQPGEILRVTVGGAQVDVRVSGVVTTGSSEDSQLLVPLAELQRWAAIPGRLSVVEVNAPPTQVEEVRGRLAAALPSADVRALRPVVESTARVLLKVRGMLFASNFVILGIVALGVATTFSAIVLDRRKDIGVMKALGAGEAQIARLFVAESALLGLAGGTAGYAAGLALAQWIGRSTYQASVAVRVEVIPQVILATMAVAVGATLFPLRIVRRVNPAVVLKGE